jgi:hypothetical protein
MPNDDFVDVGLGELLRLDAVLLRGAEQVVEEGHVELEHLDELDDAAVGDVELAVEVEGARVRVRAVDRDLAIVDIARQLGGVLVFLVLGLERADADAVLLAEEQAAHADVLHHARPVAVVAAHQLAEVVAADRAEVADDADLLVVGAAVIQLGEEALAVLGGDEVQRVLVHGALFPLALRHAARVEGGRVVDLAEVPVVGVDGAGVGLGVVLQALLEAAHDRGLRGADRAVEQQHALLGAVALGRALEEVDEAHQRDLEAEDRVVAVERLVGEELVADQALFGIDELLGAIRHNHVVDPLEGVAGHPRVARDQIQVVGKGSAPVERLELFAVLDLADKLHQRDTCSCGHGSSS